MSSEKVIITSPGPILPGTISTAHSKCGKPTCRCRQDPKYLHGPYYRWIGWINGKPTTKNISEETAKECQRRIENYKELQKKIEKTVADALDQAPWTSCAGIGGRHQPVRAALDASAEKMTDSIQSFTQRSLARPRCGM